MVQKTVLCFTSASVLKRVCCLLQRNVVDARYKAENRDSQKVSLALNEAHRKHWVFDHISFVCDEDDHDEHADDQKADDASGAPCIVSSSPVDSDEEHDDS